MRELILGGQKSGKSRLAEGRARAWLAASPTHRAILIATALPADEGMRQRIERHQRDRAARLPELLCVEEPVHLGRALRMHADAHTLVIVDCLTLWLTQLRFPAQPAAAADAAQSAGRAAQWPPHSEPPAPEPEDAQLGLLSAVREAPGSLVLVSHEIGLGVIPMGQKVRDFVDELGLLHQSLAQLCERVTLMVAGCELRLKG